jgi:hypothetical protein
MITPINYSYIYQNIWKTYGKHVDLCGKGDWILETPKKTEHEYNEYRKVIYHYLST